MSAGDFLRPASVRLEHGREDPDALLDDWLDGGALAREVIDPLGPGGSGRYLPSLWDAARDRATRAPAQDAPPGAVLVLDGALLLGRWLDLDLTVHLSLRAPTLRRRTPEADHWTLSAFERYATEVDPEATADVVVRADDPARPAIVEH
ncbi:uridine kinase [Cellulomonas sp. ATA003]|uniref:uridine kinase n=1 Tax=Cellulomonas sp. ATA003 TaxID=3073064 RepID=UPI002873BB02|nr:uridine kinase [Cellulomonas sp. ATA003]WNB87171.1 uridine kinase [Cellulomonas sp. ATA003]